jgi:cytochrome c oxidase subunit IV
MDQYATDLARSHYRGSHIFSFVAKRAGVQVDQFNFLLAETLALIFAICFRHYLPPKPSNLIKRHLVGKVFYDKKSVDHR